MRTISPLAKLLLCFYILSQILAGAAAADGFPFAVIGDMGCDCAGQQEVALKMLEWYKIHPYNLVLTVGDNIYGTTFGFLAGKMGGNKILFPDRFDKHYKPLMNEGVKFYAALGNHDLLTDNGRGLIADKSRFNIQGDKGYYEFSPEGKEDLVTFFALDSNSLVKTEPDQEQLDWLEKSLKASNSIWKIVYLHHPLYTPEGPHGAEVNLRKRIEPLLVNTGVKIVLAGHNHFYARMKPQKGITHFVTGGGGNKLKTPSQTRQAAVTARSFQFMYFELFPDHADFWSIPPDGPILDQGTIRLPSAQPQSRT
jgi:hypothetical protein